MAAVFMKLSEDSLNNRSSGKTSCLEKGQLADGHLTIEHTDNASLLMN